MSSDSKPNTVRSMTGQGHARGESELGIVSVELRTVNHRGFKYSPRTSDSLASLDNRIESLVRSLIRRGAIQLSVFWRRPAGQNEPNLDCDLLASYCRQLQQVQASLGRAATTIDLASLMSLPGVIVNSRESRQQDEPLWEFVREIIVRAVDNLNQMREAEGTHMAETLTADCQVIRARLDGISARAANAGDNYRNRLEGKIRRVLSEHELEVPAIDLLREVQIFADRVDISEEITRLAGHLNLFCDVLAGTGNHSGKREPTGRKLDFVIQEMFRETNTIGSKASDAEISAEVVEIKCAIERMRELVQNLE